MKYVDRIDGNPYNNEISNLRIVNSCYVPPDVPPLDDLSNGLEFSELGRAPMGWAGIALVFAAIALPLFGAWLIWGRH